MSKPKRKKPFNAKKASMNGLEKEGWTCWDVESRIPHTFITRDCFGFADILAMSPTRGRMFVQATAGATSSNLHAHIRKIKAEPRHAIALASGFRIQVHHWQVQRGLKERLCHTVEITALETQP